MTVHAFVSINFDADDPASVDAAVAAMNIPVGAFVSTNVSQSLTDSTGIVDEDGSITPPPTPPTPPPE